MQVYNVDVNGEQKNRRLYKIFFLLGSLFFFLIGRYCSFLILYIKNAYDFVTLHMFCFVRKKINFLHFLTFREF